MKQLRGFEIPEGVFLVGDTSEMFLVEKGWYFPAFFSPDLDNPLGHEFRKALDALKRFYTDVEYTVQLSHGDRYKL